MRPVCAEPRGKRTQVKVIAASAAERDRWKAEAKRRNWSLNAFIRAVVNREVDAAEDYREANGFKGLR